MAWYDKGKTPEWKQIVERPYNTETLLANKDLLLTELPKTEELQNYLRSHARTAIADLLELALRPSPEDASYERKYSHPTRAVELLTNESFLMALAPGKQLLQVFLEGLFGHFLSVDPHHENINLHHGYFERLLRTLTGSRIVDKLDLTGVMLEQQARHGVVERLCRHSHKLAVCCALEVMLTLDLAEPLVTLPLEFKAAILGQVLGTLAGHAGEGVEAERAENCLQLLKTMFERTINFLAARRGEPESPLTNVKMETLFGAYSLFQAHFPLLPAIVTSNADHSIKILALELLQLNQILLSQPEARIRKIPVDWALNQSVAMAAEMLKGRVSLAHPAFVDWLSISFAEVGVNEAQGELLRRMGVLQGLAGMMLAHRSNNILAAKVLQFLKIAFHNVAEGEVVCAIERHKLNPTAPTHFRLLHHFLERCLPPLETAVRQFRSINDPLFVTLFTLFKVVAQYCRNIDSLLSLYGQLEGCEAARVGVARVIEFQRSEQCFMVFEREAAKDLGKFYSDDMFVNLKPVEFAVRPLPQPPTPSNSQSANLNILIPPTQTVIRLPTTPTPITPPISISPETNTTAPQPKSDPVIPLQNDSITSCITVPSVAQQNQQNEEDSQQGNKYGSFMRERLKEVQTNLQERRAKSRTPTKIKNELKKAKNKWVSDDREEAPESAFSSQVQIKDRTPKQHSLSEPKPKQMEKLPEKIALIRIGRHQLPKVKRERLMNLQRDGRLMEWLTAVRS